MNGLANGLTGGASGRIAGAFGSGYSTCDPNYQAYVNGERGGFGTPESAVYPDFQDPTKAPGPGWRWEGNGPVGSRRGSWYNPTTDQSLHPDLSHKVKGQSAHITITRVPIQAAGRFGYIPVTPYPIFLHRS